MAESEKVLGAEQLAHAMKVDAAWSPKKLTGLGIVTLVIAFSIIVFMATRMTTCMYFDGSQPGPNENVTTRP
jgi:hypothetical protein